MFKFHENREASEKQENNTRVIVSLELCISPFLDLSPPNVITIFSNQINQHLVKYYTAGRKFENTQVKFIFCLFVF